ncbi:hypothetical protein [Streptomyces sp. NPDC048248]|uniref:hypothetical protein n=1 Tax=Streptomyces sp. NPDC048248 TaxID=3365523 RepID=UPI003719CB1C
MHVPEEIRAEAAALIDHHALGLWKPQAADRRAAMALFRFLETGMPLSAEQIRSTLATAEQTTDPAPVEPAAAPGSGGGLTGLLRSTAGLLDTPDAADGPAGRDAIDHVCLLLDAVALSGPANR